MRRRLRAVALAAAAGALAASACAERTPPADEPLIDTAGIEGGAAAPADRAAAGAPATGPV
ncbi:MAG TPA: hypothetical protein VKZ63_06275, partial [Kofleriaceae bacterium]|nr:hypothetical protein [Kofleriaceae bacterium]